MVSRLNRAFSLIEVLITVAILSTAITFIFRSFTAALSSARFSQDITLACYLAEDRLFYAEEMQRQSAAPLPEAKGSENINGRHFNWGYRASRPEGLNLIDLELRVSWREKAREKEYPLSFSTYLLPRRQ